MSNDIYFWLLLEKYDKYTTHAKLEYPIKAQYHPKCSTFFNLNAFNTKCFFEKVQKYNLALKLYIRLENRFSDSPYSVSKHTKIKITILICRKIYQFFDERCLNHHFYCLVIDQSIFSDFTQSLVQTTKNTLLPLSPISESVYDCKR